MSVCVRESVYVQIMICVQFAVLDCLQVAKKGNAFPVDCSITSRNA